MKHFSGDENKRSASAGGMSDIDKLTSALSEVKERSAASQACRQPERLKRVRAILRARRARDTYFGEEMFADPAWDALLHIYTFYLSEYRVSVSGLGHASGVAPTTALRWIKVLETKGLIQRHADPFDGRRFFLELSDEGARRMDSFFAAVGDDPLV